MGFAALKLWREGGQVLAQWDEQYKFWTLFNFNTGARVMLRFTPKGIDLPTVDRASAPMLADISITDYCPYGCTFCYRGSTTAGQHADRWHIEQIADQLADMEVFEVALGGGEPTLHPDFVNILRTFQSHHIVPNFTTKNLKWLDYEDLSQEIAGLMGNFAYSVTSSGGIRALVAALDRRGIGRHRVKVHVVMGTVSQYEIESILKYAQKEWIGVTLLGYKDDQRGIEHKNQQKFQPYADWLVPMLNKLSEERALPNLAIDTPLAAQFEQQLVTMGIPHWLFHTEEGRFSMFIDAVQMKAGKSSFGDSPLVGCDGWNGISEAFKQLSRM